MDGFIPQGGGNAFWLTLAGSGTVFTGLAYKAYRLIKGDLRDDKTVQNVDKFVETQTNKIKELEEQNRLFLERMEVLQKERGTAMALSGQLQGQIDGWKLISDRDKEQRDQKEKDLQSLKDEITKLKSQNENLLKMNTFLKPESFKDKPQNGDSTNG